MNRRPDYQTEPVHLRAGIWEAGVISALELHRIVAWKSAQGLAWVTLNTEEDIHRRSSECITAIAQFRDTDVSNSFDQWDNWALAVQAAMGSKDSAQGLLGLRGVRYPVASAVLAILAPAAFPVIDRWATKAVYGRELSSIRHVGQYRHYAQQLVAIGHHYPTCTTIHDLDKAAMNAARSCRHQVRPCLCLPFSPADEPMFP